MVVVLPSSVLVARPKLGSIFAIIKSIELDAERGACPSGVDLLGKRSPIQRSFRSICSHIELIADKGPTHNCRLAGSLHDRGKVRRAPRDRSADRLSVSDWRNAGFSGC